MGNAVGEGARVIGLAFILGIAAGCAPVPVLHAPAPPEAAGVSPVAAPAAVEAATPAPVLRPRSRWVPVAWEDLPGWEEDALAEAWPALAAGCLRPAPGWSALCAEVLLGTPPAEPGEARRWWAERTQAWRLESHDGQATGLATGYFEPLIEASRERQGAFRVPLHAAPPDLATRRPYWSRQQLETEPAAMAAVRGLELAWVADPLDALLLQIQGSGRLLLREPDGSERLVRMAFAGHNGQPYRSVGRWLVEQGELGADGASWPAIRAWARSHPRRVQPMLWANPRVVFFREEPLPDPAVGPRGAAGVPLVPGRSVAVDPLSVPYGTPMWLDTTEPLSSTPLRRLVMAQDTGSAIVGAVRVDYFWGWGAAAEQQAGRMKQGLRAWALWPRGATPPP
jgi:membrane-bound lytic murein transglycosylase A